MSLPGRPLIGLRGGTHLAWGPAPAALLPAEAVEERGERAHDADRGLELLVGELAEVLLPALLEGGALDGEQLVARVGQGDDDLAPVLRAAHAPHEPGLLEVVEHRGHR